MRDTILEPEALNLAHGRFGTCFNGQTYQIEAVVSFGGWQYATYIDHQRRVCVARRALPGVAEVRFSAEAQEAGEWQRIAFEDHTIDHTDVHNVPVIGICPADGTIHLAFDHHVSPLHYRVSRAGVATAPSRVEWSATLFGDITSELVDGHPLAMLTYPSFVTTPAGGLQLFYRLGGSGDGDTHLAAYDPGRGGWSLTGQVVSRRGRFRDSDSRNAYHNGFDYDAGGRLHTTWVWREAPELSSNHDLQYAYSDDGGRTWHNNDGARIGVAGEQPMQVDSPGITVQAVAYRWGMMNQVTQTVDSRGRVHVVMWQQPPDAPEASDDLSSWRFVHYWRDEQARWQHRQLPEFGRKPSVVADDHGNLLLVFTKPGNPEYHGTDPGGPLLAWTASAEADWSDWHELHRSAASFVGEPRLDTYRWRQERVLSVYAQEAPEAPGRPSALHVIDLEMS